MLARPFGRSGGLAQDAPPGVTLLDQIGIATNATAGAATLTPQQIMRGALNRTGPGAGFTDTWPTADEIIAAMDNPQVGDSWLFVYRNAVAFAMTFAAGTGIVSGIGTLGCAASSTKTYLHTVLSHKRTTVKIATTTNADATLTKIPVSDLKDVMPGMGASGAGIGAAAIVLGIKEVTDATTGAVTGEIELSVNSTATADNIAVTFFPRVQLDALGVQTN